MSSRPLTSAEAARRLGVSTKALRVYEAWGLLDPDRTPAGWRQYGQADLSTAATIVALRGIGLSLAQIRAVVGGEQDAVCAALEAHLARLSETSDEVSTAIEAAHTLLVQVKSGTPVPPEALAQLVNPKPGGVVQFDLPWPWGGERFAFTVPPDLTWIVGPLGSGKTQLAMCIADAVAGGLFVGLDREVSAQEGVATAVAHAEAWLEGDGGQITPGLTGLLGALLAKDRVAVVDLVEHELDPSTQLALARWLRVVRPAGPAMLMTRSSAMLDLESIGEEERVLFCPANHAPPQWVVPRPGAPGFESLAGCLATPAVRDRTRGVRAVRT